ncbi:peptidase S41 [Lewinellaceae bacterium SD302]|nr:peptidase S41 [Lewinellaceae bacterium SD302]
MTRFSLAISSLFLLFTLSAQDQFLHSPALSPDGSQLAFSYQGDIWTVATNGGTARRLTVHESYESSPVWSPDGKKIAFVGNRYGNNDLFVTDPGGMLPQRLTYHSGSDSEPNWLDNETLLFTTRRIYAQVERIPEIYRVKVSGGTPVRHSSSLGGAPAHSDRYLAFTRGGCRVSREAYRGPANRDIWVYDNRSGAFRQITTNDGQDHAPQWANGKLYFLSARDGRYNLYRRSVEDDSMEQLTKFKDWGIRSYSLSNDGKTVAISQGGKVEVSTNGGRDFKVAKIEVGQDFKFYPTEETTITSGVNEYALSPNEKYLAFVSKGEVFLKPNDKDKSRARNISDHPYKDDNVGWLNDSTLLFTSDRPSASGGRGSKDNSALKSTLLLCQPKKSENSNPYLAFQFDYKTILESEMSISDYKLSPQRDKIAVIYGRGKLATYDLDTLGNISNETVLLDGWDYPGGLSWSPDGNWLAYNLSDLDFNDEIYIHPADNHRDPVNISMHPRGDYNPVWSRDGRKLAFRSIRNNGDNDIWFVWLREEDYEKTQRDWEEAEDWEEADEKKDKKEKVQVRIDFEDIHERLVQVTSLPGNEGAPTFGPDGEYLYFTTNNGSRAGREGDSDLMKVKWDGKEMKTLLSNARVYGLELDEKGKKMYMVYKGKVASTDLDKGKAESQNMNGKMTVDHVAQRNHMLEDGWNALNDGFYDPDFHGRDWAGLKEKYRPLLLSASTRQDFSTLYNEMLGQLDASHMGFRSSVQDEEVQSQRTGFLGVELDEDGKVSRILNDGPADRRDSKLQIGDRIVAVNGERIGQNDNLYRYLNGKVDERTQLTVLRAGSEQDLLIRPGGSLRSLNYEAWVDQRKELTERYSGGRLGYIHIQGMNWNSFERFERELTAAGQGRDGVVIDVRFNGGGWTTDMLMTVLNVRQHAYTVPRGAAKSLKQNKDFRNNYPYGERLPQAALTKPSVALCNEASYSNAEIFSHAYKHLGHGTLVGQPTFGAVISTGGHGLIDGSYVRMPFRAWYVHATEENMEGGPAVPDVIVANAPNEKALNEDSQLKKAVEVLLGEMSEGR